MYMLNPDLLQFKINDIQTSQGARAPGPGPKTKMPWTGPGARSHGIFVFGPGPGARAPCLFEKICPGTLAILKKINSINLAKFGEHLTKNLQMSPIVVTFCQHFTKFDYLLSKFHQI